MSRLGELRQEAEWRRCVRDEKYFLERYWHIAHPSDGRILFLLRDAQSEALSQWGANRYSLTLKARQIGWSTLVAAHQFWLAFFHSDQNIIDLSRTEREAILLLRKTKYGASHLPMWMVERIWAAFFVDCKILSPKKITARGGGHRRFPRLFAAADIV